jgi:hypothetical protein
MQLNRDDFPSIIEIASRHVRPARQFEILLDTLNKGLAENSIRNVEFTDVKSYASKLASEAWSLRVSDVFISGGKYQSLPKDVWEFEWTINFSGIHSLPSIEKKLAKVKLDHPCIDAMKAWVVEMMPLSKAIESLKPVVVKGRAPSTEPAKPVNPNKDVKTCPCCFRAIAVGSGLMVHHGYKRPGNGEIVGNCPGIRFKPLEISPDGLHYMLEGHKATKQYCEERLAKKDEIKAFTEVNWKKQEIQIKRGDPQFDQSMKNFVFSMERDIRYAIRDIEMFEQRIANWKPGMIHKRAEPEAEGITP